MKPNTTIAALLILVGVLLIGAVACIMFDAADDGKINLFGLLNTESQKESGAPDRDTGSSQDTPGNPEQNTASTGGTTNQQPAGPDQETGNQTPSDNPSEGSNPNDPNPGPADIPGVYDKNGLVLKLLGYEERDGYGRFSIEVQNNTVYDLGFYNSLTYINGVNVSGDMYGNAAAGCTEKFYLEFELSMLEVLGTEICYVDMDFVAFDSYSYATIVEDTFTFQTDSTTNPAVSIDGILLLDQAGIQVYYVGSKADEFDFTDFYFFAKNVSGHEIDLSIKIQSIDGLAFDKEAWAILTNNGSALTSTYLKSSDLDSMGIVDPTAMVFEISASYYNDHGSSTSVIAPTNISITLP